MHMCEVWDCRGWHFLRGTWETGVGGVTMGGQRMEAVGLQHGRQRLAGSGPGAAKKASQYPASQSRNEATTIAVN